MLQPYISILKIFLNLKYGGLNTIAYILNNCYCDILTFH
jgi:hypothetical protein